MAVTSTTGSSSRFSIVMSSFVFDECGLPSSSKQTPNSWSTTTIRWILTSAPTRIVWWFSIHAVAIVNCVRWIGTGTRSRNLGCLRVTEKGEICPIPNLRKDLYLKEYAHFNTQISPSYWNPCGGLIHLEEGSSIERMSHPYDLPPTAICEKSGMMYLHQEEKKSLKKFYCVWMDSCVTCRMWRETGFRTEVRRKMEAMKLFWISS